MRGNSSDNINSEERNLNTNNSFTQDPLELERMEYQSRLKSKTRIKPPKSQPFN